jgi:rubrerythrin
MNKVLLSLNFMYFMERFATQIYRTQRGAFNNQVIFQKITEAYENEREHVRKLQSEIRHLNGRVYPCGFLFQFGGVIFGIITRFSGRRNLFKVDTFVEVRAVNDYNSFLRSISFGENTTKIIRGIIADEQEHIVNWRIVSESIAGKKSIST